MLKFILLALLPLALAAPAERSLLDSIFDIGAIQRAVSHIAHQYGDDPTEAQCEDGCHHVWSSEQSLGHGFCPFICKSFQALTHQLDHEGTAASVVG